jgi:hypothetical protein
MAMAMANDLHWRYKVTTVKPGFFGGTDPDKLQRMLDDLGREGWQLAGAVQPHRMRALTLILKRPA